MGQDIFDNEILCKSCKKVMKPELISRNGFNLRALRCAKCNEVIVHPVDKQEYEDTFESVKHNAVALKVFIQSLKDA